jgi:hypothetical protein
LSTTVLPVGAGGTLINLNAIDGPENKTINNIDDSIPYIHQIVADILIPTL